MNERAERRLFNFYILIMCLYVFRGILVYFKIENAIYFLSAILLLLLIFKNKKNNMKLSLIILLYLIISVGCFVVSLINNNLLISFSGYLSSYINFIICLLLFMSFGDDSIKKYISKYYKVIIILGTISSLFGVYQTYVDPSIFGFANNDIYGNAELLSTGRYTVRATAFLGSPQNYGLLVGIAFVLALFEKNKKFKNYVIILLIIIGIVVSGSRSASICFFIAVFSFVIYGIKDILYKKKFKKNSIMVLLVSMVFITICSIIFIPYFSNSKTASRLTNFDITPAVLVYKNALKNLSVNDFIFGKGLGYRDWVVNQFVGSNKYISSFNEVYTSTESYLLLTFLQGGIFKLLSFLLVIGYSIVESLKQINRKLFVCLVCLFINLLHTPSFSGMAMSFVLSFLIIIPFYNTKKEEIHE